MAGIILDIGTGDGKFAYKVAEENPDKLIIGINPNHKALEKISLKTQKKTQRGGLGNVLYVLSSIEELPEELENSANQIFINFPWAGLLEGLVGPKKEVWEKLKFVSMDETLIDIVVSYDEEVDKVSNVDGGSLIITKVYLEEKLFPTLESWGFENVYFKELQSFELKDYPSSWGKKLRFSKSRKYFYFRLRVSTTFYLVGQR